MNKLFFFVLLGLFLSPLVLAEDIAYIVKDTSHPETNIISSITELGYTYNLIDDSEVSSIDFSNYEMILVWDSTLLNPGNIPIKTKKSLVGNTYYIDDWGIADYAGSQISTGYLSGRINPSIESSITENIPTPVQIYSSTNIELNYLPYANKRAPSIQNLVSTNNYNQYPVVATINIDGELYGGGNAGGRICFFGATKTEYWTLNTKKLFKNSIVWVILGEDNDNDGFYVEEDCDDSNASIYPFAYEIAYNGIDEDCNGEDLIDVDGDGFDIIPYGTDCDDSNASISPNSTDLSQNCVNDAPIITPQPKITMYEGENATITLIATDPENDILTYSINDTRFLQNENVFTWQTSSYDQGTYFFTLTAHDGLVQSEIILELEVKNINQAPICNSIPEQTWGEDTTHILNLSAYCSDPDDEYIGFYINDTSEDTHITLQSLTYGIATFLVEQSWFGLDWIIFSVSDGKDTINTNNITLNVTPINDAPIFSGHIENLEWEEDTILKDAIDLSLYFSDIDSELTYSFSGNFNINITINNSLASFYPEKDWYGTENIVFKATDNEFNTYSNALSLNVTDANEPPVLNEINCTLTLEEDSVHFCNLSASDFEGDAIEFEIIDENNLNCKMQDNELEYSSYKDYNGQASCLIKIGDEFGYNDYIFEVDITPINDAPIIEDYSPKGTLKLLADQPKTFSVDVSDVDSNITFSWKLENQTQNSTENNYAFAHEEGTYILSALISDEEYTLTHEWNIFVGSLNDFTCSEVNGYVCNTYEICREDFLGVYDTTSCCPIQCSERPPEFKDIDKCGTLNENIIIDIENPREDDEFIIGETINVKVEVKNILSFDGDFNIKAYFYDITDEDSIDDDKESIDIDEGEKEKVNFEFDIDKGIEDGNRYAIFVKVTEDNDSYCNEGYVELDIEREKHKLEIKEAILYPLTSSCNDYVALEIEVENRGKNDEDVIISVKNNELGINIETEEFELEEYGEDDNEKRTIEIKIPSDAEEGEYSLRITVSSDDTSEHKTFKLKLEECKESQITFSDQNQIIINSNQKSLERTTLFPYTIIGSVVILLILLVTLYLYFFMF